MAIAAVSTLPGSGLGLSLASILVIWLATLVLVALTGFAARDRTPNTGGETESEQRLERTNELIAKNDELKESFNDQPEF